MGTFSTSTTMGLSTSDGISLSKIVNGDAMNAKALLDDNFGAPVSVDLAPICASVADPKWALLICDGDGAQLKFDGAAAFTIKAYKTMMLQLTPNSPGPSGVLDLELQTNGASSQRIRFICTGD